ncbi:MAG TPA: TetR family transcriptional regulator [Acidimicrobiia bacterium]
MSTGQPGRRPGAPDTRAEILEAARSVFAERGFDRATIRAIAANAGVDPAMIHHYFGTKDQLFTASIDIPAAATERVLDLLAQDPDDLGRHLAETFFGVWENEEPRTALLGILRSAMGGEDRAVLAFRQFLTSVLTAQLAPKIRGEGARLRALLMASQLVGVAMTRYVMRLEPIASAPIAEVIDLVAPRLQSYVDDPDG